MKVLIQPGSSGNIIATIAIGGDFFETWLQYAYPTWKSYCERHQLGLVVFTSHIDPQDDKRPQWQKLLIGSKIKSEMPFVQNICHLDTDILISPLAPNIFDNYQPLNIGLISQKNNLPYPDLESVLRRIAFLRHNCYSQTYPLDSFLFASISDVFALLGLPPHLDFACTGVFVFNVQNHSQLLDQWFHKYDATIVDKAGRGAEETYLNHELQSWGSIQWLDYRFQALWIYEMAWKYPFLYNNGRSDKKWQKSCIEASLFTNYFLHFAGAWHESHIWKETQILNDASQITFFNQFRDYLSIPVTGKPKGEIVPNSISEKT